MKKFKASNHPKLICLVGLTFFLLLIIIKKPEGANLTIVLPIFGVLYFALLYKFKGNHLNVSEDKIEEISSFKKWSKTWDEIETCSLLNIEGTKTLGFKLKRSDPSILKKHFMIDQDYILVNSYKEPIEEINNEIQKKIETFRTSGST